MPAHKVIRILAHAGDNSDIEFTLYDMDREKVDGESVENGEGVTLGYKYDMYSEGPYVMYLKVTGSGKYSFEISFEEEENISGDIFSGLLCLAGEVLFIIVIIVIVVVATRRSKKEKLPELKPPSW